MMPQAEKLGHSLDRVEQQWAERNAKDVAELGELYASNADEAAKELEEAAKIDDKLAPLKVAFRRAVKDIATLDASKARARARRIRRRSTQPKPQLAKMITLTPRHRRPSCSRGSRASPTSSGR